MTRSLLSFLALGIALLLYRPAVAEEESEVPCGSVNGDVSVNLADAVYLLHYLFRAGSAPVCAADLPDPIDGTPCERFSRSSVESCRHSARADHWTARASCEILTDLAQRSACREAAQAEFDAAMSLCALQLEVRERVCLSGADYPDAQVDPDTFVRTIDNPYFSLPPGFTFVYESRTEEGLERSSRSVTADTRSILGVSCVVVETTATLEGAVIETAEEWFAQDVEGNVWCFGERSFEYEDDTLVEVDSWEAGVDGARASVCMKAAPEVAQIYYHEFVPGRDEEIAEVVAVNVSVTLGRGTFESCLKIAESDVLEPDGVELKFYAPGVGLILEADGDDANDIEDGEREELVEIIQNPPTGG